MATQTTIPCDAPGYRVKINISVVNEDGDLQASVDYTSPEAAFGFSMLAMDADIALLAAAWAKAINEQCGAEYNEMALSVAGEAND